CLQPYRVVDTGKRLGGYRSVTVAPRGTEAVLALQAFEAQDGGGRTPTDRGIGGASADRPGIGCDGEGDHRRDASHAGHPEADPEEHAEVAQPQRRHCHPVAAFASALELGASEVAEDDAEEAEEEER